MNFNSIALALDVALVIGFVVVIWRCWDAKKPRCACGSKARLMWSQESGQRTILHYGCGPCGNQWSVPQQSFEERRAGTIN